jgi:sulfane dehydrogenase subunit SoxC
LGAHYLLNHFDVQELNPFNYSIALGGHVRYPRAIPLSELLTKQIVSQAVLMECAGTGRSELTPRPVYVPWFKNPIGNYVWTGTPPAPILQQAGIKPEAVEVLFTGWDIGVDLGIEHAFERSLPIADALRPEVMLAWLHNGQPLLPQHGFPIRLIVPSWYGMASVKWLRAITLIDEPFNGMEQFYEYRYKATPADPGLPVREKHVNSVMKPPGIPDLISRWRFIAPGTYTVTGKAWTGTGYITGVDFSSDDGLTWQPAQVHNPFPGSPYAWVTWSVQWTAVLGTSFLRCRATDSAGNVQPLEGELVWNEEGMGVNGVQRVDVIVEPNVGISRTTVPSTPQMDVPGGMLPPPTLDTDDCNLVASPVCSPYLIPELPGTP